MLHNTPWQETPSTRPQQPPEYTEAGSFTWVTLSASCWGKPASWTMAGYRIDREEIELWPCMLNNWSLPSYTGNVFEVTISEDQSLRCRPRSTAYCSVGSISPSSTWILSGQKKTTRLVKERQVIYFDTTEFLKLSLWFMFVCESIWVCDEFACVYAKARRWQYWVSSSATPFLISLRWPCYWTWKKTDH